MIISSLRQKRAKIGGAICRLEQQIKLQRVALAHIDATIRMFSPGTDPGTIPPKRAYRRTRYFARGELSRFCLDALRRAGGQPMTTMEFVTAAIAAKGLPLEAVDLTEMVLVALRRLSKKGTIMRHGTNHKATWTLPD